MKMFKLCLLLFFLSTFNANAQVPSHAIGLRLGGSHYGHYGGEISYQMGIGDANRLELDLGWRNHRHWSAMAISGIFHWVWNITGGFNLFAGPGAQIGFYRDKDHFFGDDYIGLGVGGQLGLEYNFSEHGVPLQLSLDARPMWYLNGWYNGFGYGTALGIRYVIE